MTTAIGCRSCALSAEARDGFWRAMLARLDLGHDHVGHRIYAELWRRKITAEQLAALSDDVILGWANVGEHLLTRIRRVVPAPASGCGFCDVLSGREAGWITATYPNAAVLVPAEPVMFGHLLVVSRRHVGAYTNAEATGRVLARAVEHAARLPMPVEIVLSGAASGGGEGGHLCVQLVPRSDGRGRRRLPGAAVPVAVAPPPVPLTPQERAARSDSSAAAPAGPCEICVHRAGIEGESGRRWRELLAGTDLGHDRLAHRAHNSLFQAGYTAARVAQLTDEQILAMRNAGRWTLVRIRERFPAPAAMTERAAPAEWLARYSLEPAVPAGWCGEGSGAPGAGWVSAAGFWELFLAARTAHGRARTLGAGAGRSAAAVDHAVPEGEACAL